MRYRGVGHSRSHDEGISYIKQPSQPASPLHYYCPLSLSISAWIYPFISVLSLAVGCSANAPVGFIPPSPAVGSALALVKGI